VVLFVAGKLRLPNKRSVPRIVGRCQRKEGQAAFERAPEACQRRRRRCRGRMAPRRVPLGGLALKLALILAVAPGAVLGFSVVTAALDGAGRKTQPRCRPAGVPGVLGWCGSCARQLRVCTGRPHARPHPCAPAAKPGAATTAARGSRNS